MTLEAESTQQIEWPEWLRSHRLAYPLTLKELEAKTAQLGLKVSVSYISTLERAYRNKRMVKGEVVQGPPPTPDKEVVMVLARALNADIDTALKLNGYSRMEEPQRVPVAGESYTILVPPTGPILIVNQYGKSVTVPRISWSSLPIQVQQMFEEFHEPETR